MLNRISIRQMEYFVATAESSSIIIASERIHVSSPSISAAIAHIESELQVQLFIRQHAKGLILTNVGEQVMKECQKILSQSQSLYALAANFSGSIRGPLRVGCFSAFAPMIYAEIINGFSELYKRVSLEFSVEDHGTLLDQLTRNQLDVALAYDLHIDDSLVSFEPLASLPAHALLSENHPLATAPAVTLEELSEHPMILLDMPYSNDYFISLFRAKQLNPNVVHTSKHVDIIRSMVANNIGYTILNVRPKVNFSLDGKRLVRKRISGDARPMKIGLVTAKKAVVNTVTQAFISRCRSYISNQYISGMGDSIFYDPHLKAGK